MDKATVKLLLESYRPEDAGDPIFEEALREVAADPELAVWFEKMRRFDAIVSEKLQEIAVQPDVKTHILLGQRLGESRPRPPKRPRWLVPSAVAVGLMLGLLAWRFLPFGRAAENPLAMRAISYSAQMPSLQFVCFNAETVASWINQQAGSKRLGLKLPPKDSLSMRMIGSSMMRWNNHPVVMICLQDDRHMAMLYIMDADDFADVTAGREQTMQHEGWTARTTRKNGQLRILTVKGGPANLDMPMPD